MIRPPRVSRALFDWLTLERSIAIIVIVGGGYAWLAYRAIWHGGSVGVALGLAPFAMLLIAPAVIALFPGFIGWIDERTWEPWQGIYHAFDDHQIRVIEARDRLWFSSEDVHAMLGLPRRDAVLKAMTTTEVRADDALGETLSNAGLVRLLGRSTDRRTLKFLAWAEGDVRRPWQKKRDARDMKPDAAPPPDVASDRSKA